MTPPASFLLFPWSRTLEKKSRNSMDPPSFKEIISRSLMEQKTINFSLKKMQVEMCLGERLKFPLQAKLVILELLYLFYALYICI
ncbi:uncharacterized protein LOC107494592 isoform X5 [Arachis duranensis]|uniref:Uncharacterized protein LOC107494592 isoform X5 n=1 Tax=Arachis duranensis TaxID=130453 RepID=A0A6P5MD71_ARADU|nr:uncharacterized protein LOC107494592 isoform X5 [Arachis duranensis]